MNEDKTPIGGSTGASGYIPPSPSGGSSGESTSERLGQKTQETAQSIRSQGEQLKHTVREKGTEAVDSLKSEAESAAHKATEYGRTMIQEQKETLAHKVKEYANAARAASERLRGDGDALAGPAERAATQLDRMSDYLHEKQPGDLLDDVEAFARRRPEIVFGGMFVAGLAAARFFKASRRTSRELSRGGYTGSPSFQGAQSGGVSATSSTMPSAPSTPHIVGSGGAARTGVDIGASSGFGQGSTSSMPTTPTTPSTSGSPGMLSGDLPPTGFPKRTTP